LTTIVSSLFSTAHTCTVVTVVVERRKATMSYSVNSDDCDGFFDAESFFRRGEVGGFSSNDMDAVTLVRQISFNPMVQAHGVNGSLSLCPLAAIDGFHNARQYYDDPCPPEMGGGDIDASEVSLSVNGAAEAEEEGSMSSISKKVGASPATDNAMEGPPIFSRLTAAVHHLTSLLDDDDLEDGVSTRVSEARLEPVAPKEKCADNNNIIHENQPAQNRTKHSKAKTSREAR